MSFFEYKIDFYSLEKLPPQSMCNSQTVWLENEKQQPITKYRE